MLDIGYSVHSFFMSSVVEGSDGVYEVGEEYDLERSFAGLRYKSFKGLSYYGDVKGVYSEDWAEEDGVDVYVGSDDVRSGTECELVLYFFDVSGDSDVSEGYSLAYGVYSSFVDFLSGKLVIYRDTVRRRRVLLYMEEGIEPSVDVIDGIPYLQCTFKFCNVYGRSFGLDDMTIANRLGLSSYPVYGE